MSHPPFRLLSGLLAISLAAGCGGVTPISGLVPVSGKVTYEGKAVPKGTISFTPEDPAGMSGAGVISNGSYSIKSTTSSPGLKPGNYAIAIESWESEPTMDAKGKPVPGKSAIPPMYTKAKTSGFTAKVEKKGSQKFDFDMKP